jgi:hypothetical protein
MEWRFSRMTVQNQYFAYLTLHGQHAALQACIATIVSVQEKHGVTATSLLNFVVSDGCALIATRFVSPPTEKAASLYYAEGGFFPSEVVPVLLRLWGCSELIILNFGGWPNRDVPAVPAVPAPPPTQMELQLPLPP